uniref:protein-serine/threonine phosphatase n=1 Tax=Trepomonas sp. PC1 TaxID=1076344 RepID=A0A146KMD5_9EUKA|eukprot:JAP96481.1 Protein phosphatase 2C [Trepomonas sp. PC1]
MGCIASKPATSYYESMLRKIMLYTKTKYKSLSADIPKQQQIIDELALDDMGLFISAQLNKGQRKMRIDKIPAAGREVPISSPLSIGHYTKLIYQFFGWPTTTAVIDISPHEIVTPEMITSLIYALHTLDICRSLNLTKHSISVEQSAILGGYIASSVNLQFLSLVDCNLGQKQTNDICEGLLRLARKRVRLDEIARSDEISINEQEAFIYEVPKTMCVKHGLVGLDISRNNITDLQSSTFVDAIQNHIDMQFLGMAHCNVGETTAKAFYEIMHNLNELRYLDLSNNNDFNDKCLAYLYKRLQSSNYHMQQVLLTGTAVSMKNELKLMKLLNRNQAVGQAFDDLLNGAFIRLFNTGEMAGDCHGKGSDQYVEYCTSEYWPQNLTQEELNIAKIIFSQISIQEAYVKPLTAALTQQPSESTGPVIEDFTISLSETIGRRPEMEDVVTIQSDFQEFRLKRNRQKPTANTHYEILICLFDGHGGSQCAEQMGILFPACFADTVNALLKAADLQYCYQLHDSVWEPLMFSVFQKCDETLKQRGTPSGSTCVICFCTENTIVTANAGDSRAILVREEGSARRVSQRNSISQPHLPQSNQKIFKQPSMVSQTQITTLGAEQNFDQYFENKTFDEHVNSSLNPNDIVLRLSKDHKPDLPEEKRRIESLGGYVHQGRVLSTLAVARGFGDFSYKPSVTCSPYLHVYKIQPQDAWLVVCCDGVWDVLSDVDAALLVHRSMTAGVAAITLRDESFRLDSSDNITAIAIRLFLK